MQGNRNNEQLTDLSANIVFMDNWVDLACFPVQLDLSFFLNLSFIRFHERYSFKFIESLHLNAHVCIGCAYWFLKILLFKGLRFLGILFVRVKSEAGSAERWKRTERTVQMHYKYKIQKIMKYKYKTKTNFTIYSRFVWGEHLRKALSTI